jgi:hypothetical protein
MSEAIDKIVIEALDLGHYYPTTCVMLCEHIRSLEYELEVWKKSALSGDEHIKRFETEKESLRQAAIEIRQHQLYDRRRAENVEAELAALKAGSEQREDAAFAAGKELVVNNDTIGVYEIPKYETPQAWREAQKGEKR